MMSIFKKKEVAKAVEIDLQLLQRGRQTLMDKYESSSPPASQPYQLDESRPLGFLLDKIEKIEDPKARISQMKKKPERVMMTATEALMFQQARLLQNMAINPLPPLQL